MSDLRYYKEYNWAVALIIAITSIFLTFLFVSFVGIDVSNFLNKILNHLFNIKGTKKALIKNRYFTTKKRDIPVTIENVV